MDAKLNLNLQLLEANVGTNKTQLLNNTSTMVRAMKCRLSGRCMDDTGKSAEYCMKQAEMQLRDEARAGLPVAFLGRMIGGRIARVGMRGIAKSAAKTAAKAAAAHVVQRQVEKAMDRAEGTSGFKEQLFTPKMLKAMKHFHDHPGTVPVHFTAGRPSHAHAGVIPLHMRIG